MRFARFYVGFICGLFACLVASGCRPAGSVPTVPASGRIVYAGKPVANVDVVFTPAHGRRGFATTDAEGRFTISTFARRDGAVPGKHVVTLSPHQQAGKVIEDSFAARATAKVDAIPFPKRYTSTEDSGLIVDLGDKGSRNLELALEDAK